MKYLICLSLLVCFASCETEETTTLLDDDVNLTASIRDEDQNKDSTRVYSTLDTSEDEWRCHGRPTDCAPYIIITTEKASDNSTLVLFDKLKNASTNSVKDIVIDNEKILGNLVDVSLLNKLKQNQINVIFKSNSSNKKSFLVFKSKATNSTIIAYPFNVE